MTLALDGRQVSRLTSIDVEPAASLLAHAFVDDPAVRYYFDSDVDRPRLARTMMRLVAELTLRHGEAFRIDVQGTMAGAALLLPPAVPDFPLSAVMASVLRTPSLWRPRSLRRHFGVSASIQAHRPAAACWVLLMLGVAPALQHRGHGSCLLEHVVRRIPPGGAICLETAIESNLRFYGRQGFEVTSEFITHQGRGPRLWSMWRPASPSPGARLPGRGGVAEPGCTAADAGASTPLAERRPAEQPQHQQQRQPHTEAEQEPRVHPAQQQVVP